MRVERVREKIIYAIWLAELTRHEISTTGCSKGAIRQRVFRKLAGAYGHDFLSYSPEMIESCTRIGTRFTRSRASCVHLLPRSKTRGQ